MELTQGQRAALLDGARAQGCACEPDIVAKPVTLVGDAVVVPALDVAVQHDDWCPLLHGGSMN